MVEGSFDISTTTSKNLSEYKYESPETVPLKKSKKLIPNFSMIENGRVLQPNIKAISNYQLNKFFENLETWYNEALLLPIGFMETRLYSLTEQFLVNFKWKLTKKSMIYYMHPLLCTMETDEGIKSLSPAILTRIEEGSSIKEYNFLLEFVKFLNDLLVLWGIADLTNYTHLFNSNLEEIGFINHKNLLSEIVSLETLWYAYGNNFTLLSKITSEYLKEMGKLLIVEFWNIFEILLELNKEVAQNQRSINRYEGKTNKNFIQRFEFFKDNQKNIPNHQKLRIRKMEIFCYKKNQKLERIKKRLTDFEIIYREFQKSLIHTFRIILNINKQISIF